MLLLTRRALKEVSHNSSYMLLNRKPPGGQSSRRQTSMHSFRRSPFQRVTLQVEPVVLSTPTSHFLSRVFRRLVFLWSVPCRRPFPVISRAQRKTNANSKSVFLCSNTQMHWFFMNPAKAAILQTIISNSVKCAMLWRSF